MFIKIGEDTINTDNITYAKEQQNGITVIYFGAPNHNIQIYKDDAEMLWKWLNREEIKPKTE
jgi:ABC-type Fe3+-hydroxamate transport system substrate-binding protein